MCDLLIKKTVDSDKSTVKEIVDIHIATFKGFFLTFMGKGFLRKMYSSYIKHEKSDILIAYKDEKIVGFLAYSKDMSGLYKFMIKKYLLHFAWYSLGAFIRKPKVFLRLIRAFLKPGESRREEQYIELASIGTLPNMKGMGVGSRLIDALKEEVNFDEFAYITLETDALNNEIANHFYIKNGFTLAREFETREGRKMLEYRYSGGSTLEKA